jgi:4-hydroxy-3-methylbut-2-enyl diphosphate reductase
LWKSIVTDTQAHPPIEILLASPRGFCAGVNRAIRIVESALERYGAPIYVRHEIVHNRHVVHALEKKGAIFIDDLDEADPARPVIFSAHGVPKSVPELAEERDIFYLDATCPLVSKVHIEAERLSAQGHEIVLIGHAGHPEVVGTMGQLPPGAIRLIETVEDAESFRPDNPERLAYLTQTTLSIEDTGDIVAALKRRFPDIVAPRKDDICYATANRQDSVKRIAPEVDLVLVVGAPNSSNSLRLVEVAKRAGCPKAMLVQAAGDIDWRKVNDAARIGITAGASTPEILVRDVVDAITERYGSEIHEVTTTRESVHFKLPRVLQA